MFFRRKTTPVSWIAVFLGNPGLRYENTRHNAGFVAADILAKELGVKINRSKFYALMATVKLGDEQVLMLKPQTYMNLSGNSVRQAMKFYNVPLENVIAITDDVSLPIGKLRIRRRGSAGGHNGLRDIIAKCGGEDFPRVRIGVGGPPHEEYDMADWVLSRFSSDETKQVSDSCVKATKALELIITRGLDAAMAEFN